MRIAMLISVLVNIVAVGSVLFVVHHLGGWGYVKAKYYEKVDGSPYTDPRRPFLESSAYRQAVTIHNLSPVEKGDVVFAGDSHAAVGDWAAFFGSSRIRNRGISGDNTLGVLNRLETIMPAEPSAVFLFVGSNDVDRRYGGLTIDETMANVEQIISAMKNISPDTEIYLLSAPPKSRNTVLNATETPLAHALNEQYAVRAAALGATYVDIEGPLTDAGRSLRTDFTEDGGHLNGAGYAAVLSVVRPLVDAALNRPSQRVAEG